MRGSTLLSNAISLFTFLPACSGGYYDAADSDEEVYYDDFYGPYTDGYWGADACFYYRCDDGRFLRDEDGHFRREAFAGARRCRARAHH